MVKFNLTARLVLRKLFAGFEGQYMSSRRTLWDNPSGSYFITNLTVFNRDLLNGLELSASIYNLFDERYGDPGFEEHEQELIEQDGRSFRIKVTYNFGAR